jgi:dethiobiotin synthetase
MSVLVVTGTSTDVGKTVATAALAACASGRVAVVKPAQTGVRDDEPGDLAEVTRLTGVTDTHEFARYPDPLSPHQAARLSGRPPLGMADVAQRIEALAADHDTVIVEGAGGLLVPFAEGEDEWTLADLAGQLDAPAVVVTQPGLGTLNHTLLTLRQLAASGVELGGLLIGSWPADPDLAMRCNVEDLLRLAPQGELAGVLPAGMAAMRDFPEQARAALAPHFGGSFDTGAFRLTARP